MCGDILAALHQLVAETTTLDVLEVGPAIKINKVLQLNGVEPTESVDLSEMKLGPASAAIICACLGANKVLKSLECASLLPRPT